MEKRRPIKIDVNQIPEAEMRLLCATFLKAAREFYSDPANVEAAEKWKQSQGLESSRKAATLREQGQPERGKRLHDS